MLLAERFNSDLVDDSKSAVAVELKHDSLVIAGQSVARITGEFWTAGQRRACSLHELSYRACFKPQLPAYFIRRFTKPDQVVYDPFSGRGTTAIEAALQGRRVIANDANPLSAILARPRVNVPHIDEITERLSAIKYRRRSADIDLSMFYHPDTEGEIVALRAYLARRRKAGIEDAADAWIRMVATNRLTGHSAGFFSVYTFPPNQAVTAEAQIRINAQRKQSPTYRDTKAIIFKKSRQLLSGVTPDAIAHLKRAGAHAIFITGSAAATSDIADGTVDLTVTSPPFLDVVQYARDNWLRCWFNDLDMAEVEPRITMAKNVEAWRQAMAPVLNELYRVTRSGGVIAFEVGEVRKGKINLEEHVVPLALESGLDCEAILVNAQTFTKTANIWGVSNNTAGTNSNRIVVLRKPASRRLAKVG